MSSLETIKFTFSLETRPGNFRKILFSLLISTFLLVATTYTVPAQEIADWTNFERVPGYLDNTFPPYLVADQNKTVHAFALQTSADDPTQSYLVYRKWGEDIGWSDTVEILRPAAGEAQLLGVFLDQQGLFHLIYQSNNGVSRIVNYSSAPAISAGRATAWSKPIPLSNSAITPSSGAIAGDGKNRLTVVFNGNKYGNGVYATNSTDSGQSWSEAEPVLLTHDPGLIPYSLKLEMGQQNRMHSTWNLVSSLGVDKSLYYARQDMDSFHWSDPLILDERIEVADYFGPSFPSIVDNGKYVVIMYNGGSQAKLGLVEPGRPVQRVHMSADNGETWSSAVEPFPRLQGRSGSHALLVDGDGIIHALAIQRIDQTIDGQWEPIGGMWHSELRDQRWSDPQRILMGKAGHDLSAVVSQGNTLFVTMREDPGSGVSGVYYSYTHLDVPQLPVIPLPTAISRAEQPTSPISEIATDQLLSDPESDAISPVRIVSDDPYNPGNLVLEALIPVAVILAGIIATHQTLNRIRRRPGNKSH